MPPAPGRTALRILEDAGAAPLLQPTKGMHVVVDRSRLDHRDGIIFTSPIDGRVLFILPWGDLSYIGTTDTDTAETRRRADGHSDDEIVYLLRSANARFPSARLGLEDVRATWAGLRPLLAAMHRPRRTAGAVPGARDRPGLGRDDHASWAGSLPPTGSMATEVVDRADARAAASRGPAPA